MSIQLPPEGGFQGFLLHICIKIMSAFPSHHFLKLLAVSNQVRLWTKVERVTMDPEMSGYEGSGHSLSLCG